MLPKMTYDCMAGSRSAARGGRKVIGDGYFGGNHLPSSLLSPPPLCSPLMTKRRKNIQIRYHHDDCKFMQCAIQLVNHSSDHVGVVKCGVHEHEAADVQRRAVIDEDDAGRQLKDGEIETPPSACSPSDAKTMIITTTTFATIPMLPSRKQNTIYIKPLIVLDLNGILCHRVRESKSPTSASKQTSCTRHRKSIGRLANTEIIPRSDLTAFLQFLNRHFALAVWTSATAKTAKALVRMLFPENIRKGLVFVWHRSFCNLVKSEEIDDEGRRKKKRRRKNGNSLGEDADIHNSSSERNAHSSNTLNEHHQGLVAVKSLSKVWSSYPIWDQSNTLLLDDSPDKCPRRYQSNAIHPPPLCGTETFQGDASISIERNEDATTNEKNVTNQQESSVVDDDETNQTLQHRFFELLAAYWSAPQTRIMDRSVDGTVSTNGKNLNEFLEEHANSHNMQWSN